MKIELEIEDSKAEVLMEVLENIPFVKVKRKKTKKEKLIEEFKEAIEELNQIKAGKKQGRNAKEFLKELQNNIA